jgi:hypothetical protein
MQSWEDSVRNFLNEGQELTVSVGANGSDADANEIPVWRLTRLGSETTIHALISYK